MRRCLEIAKSDVQALLGYSKTGIAYGVPMASTQGDAYAATETAENTTPS
jgi:hypothetical protein